MVYAHLYLEGRKRRSTAPVCQPPFSVGLSFPRNAIGGCGTTLQECVPGVRPPPRPPPAWAAGGGGCVRTGRWGEHRAGICCPDQFRQTAGTAGGGSSPHLRGNSCSPAAGIPAGGAC